MAPPRIIDPFGYVHVGSRGNFGRPLYEDPSHRTTLLYLYARVARELLWTTLAYCLMTNHYHFVIKLTDGGLSEGMQQLNGGFSRRMNAIGGRTGAGHLFKNRFDAKPIETDAHLLEACRYVVLNPVFAGLCDRPEDSTWSSYRASAGLDLPPPFLAVDELLALFGNDVARAREAYIAFVSDGHVRWSDQRKAIVTGV
jgi:putative transposase